MQLPIFTEPSQYYSRGLLRFRCHSNQTPETMAKALYCGHPPSEHGPHTTGYGIDKYGNKHCYECCARHDKIALLMEDRFFCYIGCDGATLVNWPGHSIGRVLRWGRCHPWSGERKYVRVVDCHGQEWHGTGAPGMYTNLRKAKTRNS